MTDIVGELAKVLAAQATNAINREVARAILDSGLVVSRKHHDGVVDVHDHVVNGLVAERDEARSALAETQRINERAMVKLMEQNSRLLAERDEARAALERERNGPDHTYRCAFLTRAENAEAALRRVRELADQPTVILNHSELALRYEGIRRAIEGGGDDD